MIYNELLQRGTTDFPMELYQVDKNHPRYEMEAHWHSEIELMRVISGKLTVKLNNSEYTAYPGDVVFVNSETVHSASPEDCVYDCIVMHLHYLNANDEGCRFFIENLLSQEYRIKEYSPADESRFNNTINFIFDSLRDKPPGYKFSVIGAMYSLFGIVLDEGIYTARAGHSPADEKSVVKLKNVLTYIIDNYDKQLSLEQMAKSAGMSPKYFCLFFRNMTGKTPLEYLNGYRVEKATKELIKTYKTVTEIAFSCGFNDLSYFIKTFKKHKGVTPAKFRRR